MSSCVKHKQLPLNWTEPAGEIGSIFSPTTRKLSQGGSSHFAMLVLTDPGDVGGIHSIGSPIHVYPLYENGFRAHRNQSIKENNQESAEMYAQFSQVAAQHQYSWAYGKPAHTAEDIGTVSEKNRMICFPCMYSRTEKPR